MNTLGEKINVIFNSGKSIRFQNVVKRKDGKWHNRIVWSHTEIGHDIHSCSWWGFDTIEEAVDDCLNYLLISQL